MTHGGGDIAGVCLGPVIELLLNLLCGVCGNCNGCYIPSTGTVSVNTTASDIRSRRLRNTKPSKCTRCFLGCFGAGPMRKGIRSMVFISWFTVIALSALLLVRYGTFGGYYTQLSPLDQRPLARGVSPTFCDSVSVTSQQRINVFRSDGTPSLAPGRETYNTSKQTILHGKTHEYWGYYLLRDSTYKVEICATEYAYIYVIRGEENMNQWKKSSCLSCNDYYITRKKLHFPTTSCLTSPSFTTVEATAKDSDNYYFAVTPEESYKLSHIKAEFILNRTRLDLHGADKVCKASETCQVDLGFNTDDKVILEAQRNTKEEQFDVQVVCDPRGTIYLAVFLLPLTVVCVSVTLLIFRFCKNPPPKSDQEDQEELLDTSDLTYGSTQMTDKEELPRLTPGQVKFVLRNEF